MSDRNIFNDIKIKVVLNKNSHPNNMFQKFNCVNSKSKNSNPRDYYASFPYTKSYSERITQVLSKCNIQTYYGPFNKLQNIFGLPQDLIAHNTRRCL